MATTLSLLRFAPLPPRLTRSSLTINLTPFQTRLVRIRQPCVPPISASHTVPAMDRAISILTYIIPFLDSVPYGDVLHAQYPFVTSLISPFLPMAMAYINVEHLDVLATITLYLSLAQNPKMSKFVRFNAMQAVVLDLMLTLPVIVMNIVGIIPSSGNVPRVVQFGCGAMFVLGIMAIVYSVLCCLVGRTSHVPFVSSAVDKLL